MAFPGECTCLAFFSGGGETTIQLIIKKHRFPWFQWRLQDFELAKGYLKTSKMKQAQTSAEITVRLGGPEQAPGEIF